jgi:hypothetical protein
VTKAGGVHIQETQALDHSKIKLQAEGRGSEATNGEKFEAAVAKETGPSDEESPHQQAKKRLKQQIKCITAARMGKKFGSVLRMLLWEMMTSVDDTNALAPIELHILLTHREPSFSQTTAIVTKFLHMPYDLVSPPTRTWSQGTKGCHVLELPHIQEAPGPPIIISQRIASFRAAN